MSSQSRTFREFTPETAYDYLMYRLHNDLFVQSQYVPASMQHILFASELDYYNIEQLLCIAVDIWNARRYQEIKADPSRLQRIEQLEQEWTDLAGEPVTVEFIDSNYFGTASEEGIKKLANALRSMPPTRQTRRAYYGWANLFQVWYLKIDE